MSKVSPGSPFEQQPFSFERKDGLPHDKKKTRSVTPHSRGPQLDAIREKAFTDLTTSSSPSTPSDQSLHSFTAASRTPPHHAEYVVREEPAAVPADKVQKMKEQEAKVFRSSTQKLIQSAKMIEHVKTAKALDPDLTRKVQAQAESFLSHLSIFQRWRHGSAITKAFLATAKRVYTSRAEDIKLHREELEKTGDPVKEHELEKTLSDLSQEILEQTWLDSKIQEIVMGSLQAKLAEAPAKLTEGVQAFLQSEERLFASNSTVLSTHMLSAKEGDAIRKKAEDALGVWPAGSAEIRKNKAALEHEIAVLGASIHHLQHAIAKETEDLNSLMEELAHIQGDKLNVADNKKINELNKRIAESSSSLQKHKAVLQSLQIQHMHNMTRLNAFSQWIKLNSEPPPTPKELQEDLRALDLALADLKRSESEIKLLEMVKELEKQAKDYLANPPDTDKSIKMKQNQGVAYHELAGCIQAHQVFSANLRHMLESAAQIKRLKESGDKALAAKLGSERLGSWDTQKDKILKDRDALDKEIQALSGKISKLENEYEAAKRSSGDVGTAKNKISDAKQKSEVLDDKKFMEEHAMSALTQGELVPKIRALRAKVAMLQQKQELIELWIKFSSEAPPPSPKERELFAQKLAEEMESKLMVELKNKIRELEHHITVLSNMREPVSERQNLERIASMFNKELSQLYREEPGLKSGTGAPTSAQSKLLRGQSKRLI